LTRVSGLFRKIRNEKVIYNFASGRGRGRGCGLSTGPKGSGFGLGCIAHGSSPLGAVPERPKGAALAALRNCEFSTRSCRRHNRWRPGSSLCVFAFGLFLPERRAEAVLPI